jgi:hypothetical protein
MILVTGGRGRIAGAHHMPSAIGVSIPLREIPPAQPAGGHRGRPGHA